jgi:uncharacterized protein RhaS with RHS repeats
VGKYGVMVLNDHQYYMRARHYDPTIGRFLSEDPIWSTNLYPYADNNPIMGIDPRGERMEHTVGNITGYINDKGQICYEDKKGRSIWVMINKNNERYGSDGYGNILCSKKELDEIDKVLNEARKYIVTRKDKNYRKNNAMFDYEKLDDDGKYHYVYLIPTWFDDKEVPNGDGSFSIYHGWLTTTKTFEYQVLLVAKRNAQSDNPDMNFVIDYNETYWDK